MCKRYILALFVIQYLCLCFADEKKLYWRPNDSIHLTIIQNNYKPNYESFDLYRQVRYTGNPNNKEHLTGPLFYGNCNNYCNHSFNIAYHEESEKHMLGVTTERGNFLKNMYVISSLRDTVGSRYNPYKGNQLIVTYTVDWSTGNEDTKISEMPFTAPPINPGFKPAFNNKSGEDVFVSDKPEHVKTVSTSATQIPPVNDIGHGKKEDLSTEGICGIIALAIIAICAVSWTVWKCKHKEPEPLYTEIQYSDLQPNAATSQLPLVPYEPYSNIKGVLIPNSTLTNGEEVTNTSQDMVSYSEIKRQNDRRLPSLPN